MEFVEFYAVNQRGSRFRRLRARECKHQKWGLKDIHQMIFGLEVVAHQYFPGSTLLHILHPCNANDR